MYPTRISITLHHDDVVSANEGPDLIVYTGETQLGLNLGGRPAERAVIADRLIEALQDIRQVALRQAVDDGEAVFDKPDGLIPFQVSRVAGIPIPPVRFRAKADATNAELEAAAVTALTESEQRLLDGNR